MSETKHGIVYVLTNPAMPGLVKIGRTTNEIIDRLNGLNTTGVPLPFECSFACEVDDCKLVEDALHKAFYPNRINRKREFFKIDPDQAIVILRLFTKKDVTPAVTEEINKSVFELDYNIQPTRYWSYNGKSLNAYYNETYAFVD